MRTIVLILVAALAGCAGAPEPAADIDPPAPREPTPAEPAGILHVTLSVDMLSETAPADVEVTLDIQPTNAIGEPLPASVSWELSLEGHRTRSGQGLSFDETFTLQRGTHRVTATASADGFRTGNATTAISVSPVPLSGRVTAPENATRGVWVDIAGEAYDGYADVGHTCLWRTGPAVQVEDEGACATRARWLEEGQQTLHLTVDDQHENATASKTIEILPLEAMAAPTAVPADPAIVDDEDEAAPPHTNITHAWFDSDVDHLYVGLAVELMPDGAAALETTYRVSFTPSWNATDREGSIISFRVTAMHPIIDGTSPGTQGLRLEAWTDAWQDVGEVAGSVDPASGILWWQVPRDTLQAPLQASITGFLAEAGASRAPSDAWDGAAGDGSYTLD